MISGAFVENISEAGNEAEGDLLSRYWHDISGKMRGSGMRPVVLQTRFDRFESK